MGSKAERMLMIEEVAERCRTNVSTVRHWLRHGKLTKLKPGKRVLVRESEVNALLAAAQAS